MKTLVIVMLFIVGCNKSPDSAEPSSSSSRQELRQHIANKLKIKEGDPLLPAFCALSCLEGDPRAWISKASFNQCLNPKSAMEEIDFLQKNGKSPYADMVNQLIEESLNEWATSKENIDKVLGTMKD